MTATLCGVPENAEALLAHHDTKFTEINTMTAEQTEDKPVVYMADNSDCLPSAPVAICAIAESKISPGQAVRVKFLP